MAHNVKEKLSCVDTMAHTLELTTEDIKVSEINNQTSHELLNNIRNICNDSNKILTERIHVAIDFIKMDCPDTAIIILSSILG